MHDSPPLVSIITVCLNSERYIEDAIKSVIGQTYPNIEYIIVDGGSKDQTMEIVMKYRNNINTIISEPDCGIYDAMNKGIKNSNGEIIGILNSDDWYEKDTVEQIVRESYRDTRKKFGIFHGDILVWDRGQKPWYYRKPGADISNLTKRIILNHPACFVRKSLYESIGLYDITYQISSDFDFLLRAYLNNVMFKYLGKTLTNVRTGGISTINYMDVMWESARILSKYGFATPGLFVNLYWNYLKYAAKKIICWFHLGFLIEYKRTLFEKKKDTAYKIYVKNIPESRITK
ncbi:MAG: glycosyltransferase family 2 protein [Bacillota bacterium]